LTALAVEKPVPSTLDRAMDADNRHAGGVPISLDAWRMFASIAGER
jgi:hypothetical protein